MLGIGFTERDTAFDFRNALNEIMRFVTRMKTAEQVCMSIVISNLYVCICMYVCM